MRKDRHHQKTVQKIQPLYLILLFVLAFFTILLTSKSSPLYLFNDWVDVNAFMTMGKGWINGLIPYRDLFEQKGPVLYAVFALGNAISKTYFGIYLIESLLFFASLLLVYKISRHFLEERQSFLVCCLTSWILTMSPYFTGGSSAEELSYVLIFYSIYLLLELIDQDFQITNKQSYLAGLCFALLFWTKFTMIGSYLGAFVVLIGVYIFRKQLFTLASMMFFSIFGFLTLTLPIVVYFAANQALDDLKFNYFTSNMLLYPSNKGASIIWKVYNAINGYINDFSGNFVLFFLFILMLVYLLYSKVILKSDLGKLAYCAMYLGLVITTFFGGRFSPYYFLILFPFCVLPIVSLVKLFSIKKLTGGTYFLLCMFSLILTIGYNDNLLTSKLYPDNQSYTYYGEYEEPYQASFSKIINKSDNPTLLNYSSLDIGLYHAADVLPTNRFFEKQNIPNEYLPEMMEEQNAVVSGKKVEFIVIRTNLKSDEKNSVPDVIRKNYKLVATQNQSHMNTGSYTYRLYQVKKIE